MDSTILEENFLLFSLKLINDSINLIVLQINKLTWVSYNFFFLDHFTNLMVQLKDNFYTY